jgi:hypothetical protein
LLPALSEDPADYNSGEGNCRFHFPTTIEDMLGIGAALTLSYNILAAEERVARERRLESGLVILEAQQKCFQEHYNFELTKNPGLPPLDLCRGSDAAPVIREYQ